ncbi:NrtA/SsuA/CpmA family ABC transporter substrate-binding protein [Anaerococcus porci]|uniref:ABC transporter substrate-binding protein n=1 Tax=Anaerococcus porci TaxID=2652269 RepID=UPI002A75A304|nr:NrtA/SsuA/CpmA family ABC transporter substrate-binding protein [Anaerococcus porci]MDY3006564.1 NrtA/SsuA/CpmA family ABC transporter substrate-binding protein [Anaerococcus porci]
MKNKILKILSIFVLILSVSACSKQNTNDNTTSNDVSRETKNEFSIDELNISYVTAPLNVPSIVEKNKAFFQKHLPGVKINYKEITSGADQTQALASGDVDILFGLGGSSAVLAKSNGQDLKVINMYSRAPEAFSIFSKDNSIKNQDDLRGKKIGGPVGTNLHQLLLSYLWLNGMTDKDVEFSNMSIPDAGSALESGNLDVALLGGVAAYKAKEAGLNEVVNGKGLIDAIICVASSDKFINNHPDVINALKEAHDETLGFMEEEPEKTREIVKKELDLDDKAYDYMYPMYDFSNEIKEEDKKGFERTRDFMLDNGMIENKFNIDDLF